jgi:diguanylate cyclase (GGDEF)-like protein/PAS domain S-box-containing protein
MMLAKLLDRPVGVSGERLEDLLLMQTMSPPEKRGWVRARQIEAFKQLLYQIPAANVFNALIIALTCWGTELQWPILTWVIVVALVSSLPIMKSLSGKSITPPETRSSRGIWRMVREAFLLASIWSIMPILVFQLPDENLHMITAVVVAGMMCGAGFIMATVAPAALVFAGTLCIGGQIALWLEPSDHHTVLSVLLFAYMLVLVNCITWTQRLFIRQLLAQAAANEKTQLIGLLLKEFEQGASDWLWQTDEKGCIVEPSVRFADALGMTQEELAGKRLLSFAVPGGDTKEIKRHFEGSTAFCDIDLALSVASGTRWLSMTGQPILENGRTLGFRGVASDVTATREASLQIAFLAHNDSLTGLPNRVSLRRCLDRLVRETPTDKPIASALLVLDIDQFKWVNDTLGHPAGDALLRRLSSRLSGAIPEATLISRLSGDEFAIVLPAGLSANEVDDMVSDLVTLIAAPFEIMGTTINSGASVGVRLIEPQDRDPDALLRQADLALYKAKNDGRGCHRYFVSTMEEAAQDRRAIEADLQQAIARNEFELAFQPVWDVQSGALTGCEALVRWNHPTRGLLSPGAFIEIAEHCGVIEPIGTWVLRAALDAARQLPESLTMAVNVSPIQLLNPSFSGMVVNALATSGVAPQRLELEITESALFDDTDNNLAALRQVAGIGVRIALDDFGTGFSSLSHLRVFPFNRIKIDRSFVAQVVEREDCRAIIRAVCAMAKALEIETTAEGVETDDQLALIRAVGCHQVQGYLLARPQTLDALTNLIGRPTPIAFTAAA